MKINYVQRLLLVAGVLVIVTFAAIYLVDGWEVSDAFSGALSAAAAPLIVLGLLFLAAWGIPDGWWPWSPERKVARDKRKTKLKASDRAKREKSELAERIESANRNARMAFASLTLDLVKPSRDATKFQREGFEALVAEARLKSHLFAYLIEFLPVPKGRDQLPAGTIFVDFREAMIAEISVLAEKHHELWKGVISIVLPELGPSVSELAQDPRGLVLQMDQIWLDHAKDGDISKLTLPFTELSILVEVEQKKCAAERLMKVYEMHAKARLGIK